MQLFSQFYQPGEQVVFSDELVYEIYRRQPPPDSTLEALIGIAFRLTSINLLFTSDVMAHLGVLVARDHRLGLTNSLTPYFKAATLLDFEYYARQILYPYARETAPGLAFEELAERDSLRAIADYLRQADQIGLMHNADDILLSADELDFLREVFGARAQIYPKGGHVGNMLYPRQRGLRDRLLRDLEGSRLTAMARRRTALPLRAARRRCSAAAPARRSCRPRSRPGPSSPMSPSSPRCWTSSTRSKGSTARCTTSMPGSTATSSCRSSAATSS